VEAKREHGAQEAAHLPVDPLHGVDERAHAAIEPEGVQRPGPFREPLQVLGQRLVESFPVDPAEDGAGLAKIDPRGRLICLRRREHRHRVLGHDAARRESLGGDRVRDLPGCQLGAGDGAGEDRQRVPLRAHVARAALADPDARLVVERVVALDRTASLPCGRLEELGGDEADAQRGRVTRRRSDRGQRG
jgi:hypothetical protein